MTVNHHNNVIDRVGHARSADGIVDAVNLHALSLDAPLAQSDDIVSRERLAVADARGEEVHDRPTIDARRTGHVDDDLVNQVVWRWRLKDDAHLPLPW